MESQASLTSRMLFSHPRSGDIGEDTLAVCIDACFTCAQTCVACADACLGEERLEILTRCIRTNQDCADVCTAMGRVLSRQVAPDPNLSQALLRACETACRVCADECAQHAEHMEHCRICADACRACATACAAVLAGDTH